jgi:hypothetical protein
MDTRALGNKYNGQWMQAFKKGPWINLENKRQESLRKIATFTSFNDNIRRYIRKTIERAKSTGHCIELNDYNGDLMLNWTAHYSRQE